jgi:hypothetical protein
MNLYAKVAHEAGTDGPPSARWWLNDRGQRVMCWLRNPGGERPAP